MSANGSRLCLVAEKTSLIFKFKTMNTDTKQSLNSAENGNKSKPMLANRIFKLRAWVRNELMVNVVSIDFNNEFITWDDNQYDRCVPPNKCYEIETFDDIVLMQFTNFKDKKGIDIYEGDKIKYKNFKGYSTIVFENGAFGYYGISCFITLLETNRDYIEVIGNVFQDSE